MGRSTVSTCSVENVVDVLATGGVVASGSKNLCYMVGPKPQVRKASASTRPAAQFCTFRMVVYTSYEQSKFATACVPLAYALRPSVPLPTSDYQARNPDWNIPSVCTDRTHFPQAKATYGMSLAAKLLTFAIKIFKHFFA